MAFKRSGVRLPLAPPPPNRSLINVEDFPATRVADFPPAIPRRKSERDQVWVMLWRASLRARSASSMSFRSIPTCSDRRNVCRRGRRPFDRFVRSQVGRSVRLVRRKEWSSVFDDVSAPGVAGMAQAPRRARSAGHLAAKRNQHGGDCERQCQQQENVRQMRSRRDCRGIGGRHRTTGGLGRVRRRRRIGFARRLGDRVDRHVRAIWCDL